MIGSLTYHALTFIFAGLKDTNISPAERSREPKKGGETTKREILDGKGGDLDLTNLQEARPAADGGGGRRASWKAGPGYSSGASSLLPTSSSDESLGRIDDASPVTTESKHSDILSTLKDELANSSLTTKVVRLEVSRRWRMMSPFLTSRLICLSSHPHLCHLAATSVRRHLIHPSRWSTTAYTMVPFSAKGLAESYA